jgi:peptidoglycan/LPS O-acetylase OafA/YrhL
MSSGAAEAINPNMPRSWIQPHYASFNGLRGLAVLIVFFEHYCTFWNALKPQYYLWVGVDLFFVLSGFLITGILYDSRDSTGYFRNFYIRRSLRIFPVFYLVFAVLLICTPVFHLLYPASLFSWFFYIGNLYEPFAILHHTNPTEASVIVHGVRVTVLLLGHFWSLCVEEQFYLVWPAIVWLVRDRRRLMTVCVIVSVLVLALRMYLNARHNLYLLLFISTYTRIDTLLIGAWMALWLRRRALSSKMLRRIAYPCILLPGAFVVARIAHIHAENMFILQHNRFVTTYGFTLIALTAAGIILLSLDDSTWLSAILRWRPLAYLGTVSYGFYVFHLLPVALLTWAANLHPQLGPWMPLVGFALSLGVAGLSFRYFETPFLRLKRVWAPQEILPAAGHLHVSEPQA